MTKTLLLRISVAGALAALAGGIVKVRGSTSVALADGTYVQVDAFVTHLVSVARAVSSGPTYLSGVETAIEEEVRESFLALVAKAPTYLGALAENVKDLSCRAAARDEHLVAALLVGLTTKDPVAREAIDCLVSSGSIEDAVTWRALEAWRDAGYPQTSAIRALAGRTQDARTRDRLMT